jgi:CubicO group peptidase (beta-lactamase class C family)
MTRRGAEALLALVLAAALLVIGGGAVVFFATISPVHNDPASVPSTVAAFEPRQYSAAVDDSRRLVRALVVDDNLPGLSVAVAMDGELVWAEGFGFADVKRRAPVTPLTKFRLGSVSKTLTAGAVALLHDRGRIDLDAAVQTYVHAYPQKRWTITTRQLMGDIAGVHFIRGDNNDSMPARDCASLDEALQIFAGEPLLFQPGTKYRFSTNGWILLSAVVEAAADEPFFTFMTRAVFTPLGMESTVVETDATIPELTSFYFPRAALNTQLGVEEASRRHNSCLFGAGAYLSTPTDLARFGSAMLKPGLLKPDTIELLQTPLRLTSGASTDFALGWKVEHVPLNGVPVRMVAHRANPMGGTTALLMFPEHRMVIAVASNVSNAERVAPFGVKIAEAFARPAREHPAPTDRGWLAPPPAPDYVVVSQRAGEWSARASLPPNASAQTRTRHSAAPPLQPERRRTPSR